MEKRLFMQILSTCDTATADFALTQIEALKALGFTNSELGRCLYKRVSRSNLIHEIFRERSAEDRAVEAFKSFLDYDRQEDFFSGDEHSLMFRFCREAAMDLYCTCEDPQDVIGAILDVGNAKTLMLLKEYGYMDHGRIYYNGSQDIYIIEECRIDKSQPVDEAIIHFEDLCNIGFPAEDLARVIFTGDEREWWPASLSLDREESALWIFNIIIPKADIISGQADMLESEDIYYPDYIEPFKSYFTKLVDTGFDKYELASIYTHFTRGDVYTYEEFKNEPIAKRVELVYDCINSYWSEHDALDKLHDENPGLASIALAKIDFGMACDHEMFILRDDFYSYCEDKEDEKELDSIIDIDKSLEIIREAYAKCTTPQSLQEFFGENGVLAQTCRQAVDHEEQVVLAFLGNDESLIQEFNNHGCVVQ